MIHYRTNTPLDPDAVIRVFRSSGIHRPVDDRARIEAMFRHANLVISAWDDQTLVGVCRALTDFSWCCYLSDLAVSSTHQRTGIGRHLIELVQAAVGPQVSLILLSAPGAMRYYPSQGFSKIDNGFTVRRKR